MQESFLIFRGPQVGVANGVRFVAKTPWLFHSVLNNQFNINQTKHNKQQIAFRGTSNSAGVMTVQRKPTQHNSRILFFWVMTSCKLKLPSIRVGKIACVLNVARLRNLFAALFFFVFFSLFYYLFFWRDFITVRFTILRLSRVRRRFQFWLIVVDDASRFLPNFLCRFRFFDPRFSDHAALRLNILSCKLVFSLVRLCRFKDTSVKL
jgi:hypothetical protein